MATANSLKRQVERLLEVARSHRPKDDYRLSDEWQVIQSVMMQTVASFPDAELAVVEALERIEQMSRAEWIPIRTMLVQALMPYLEARIAIASALMEAEKAA